MDRTSFSSPRLTVSRASLGSTPKPDRTSFKVQGKLHNLPGAGFGPQSITWP